MEIVEIINSHADFNRKPKFNKIFLKALYLVNQDTNKAFNLGTTQLFQVIVRFACVYNQAIYFNVSHSDTHESAEAPSEFGDLDPIYPQNERQSLLDALTKVNAVIKLWHELSPDGLTLNINVSHLGEKLFFASKEEALAYKP